MARELKLGRYVHFKGKDKIYEVLGKAMHTETLEELVIYKALYGNKSRQLFARPIEVFMEEVPEGKENPNGQKYRFEYMGE